MSYLVLARKYRPMFFEDVMGQQHVTQTLQNAILQNRIANAYLFSGPRGVGKTTVARLLAKSLNCEKGPTTHPCNECSSCREINESRSLDVFEIDGASNRGIDEVRNLRESLHYSPNPGKHRIYIIDEVHMLTNEAFNALLKTLEEPPSRVLFIFATTEAHKVPATILSRCQQFDFKRMPHAAIVEQLRSLCDKEGISIDEESLRLIALRADGSMRDSQSILDQVIAFSGTTIHAKDTVTLLGIIDQDILFEITDIIHASDVVTAMRLTDRIYAEGYDFNDFLISLQEHLRNFMIVKTTSNTDLLNVSEEHKHRYFSQVEFFTIEDLLRLIKIAADTEYLLRRTSNGRLHFEMAIVKMVKMNTSVQLGQLIDKMADVKKKIDNSNELSITSPALSQKNPPSVPPKPSFKSIDEPSSLPANDQAPNSVESNLSDGVEKISLTQVEEQWEEITTTIKKRKIALGSFLNEGWPTKINGNQLFITFDVQNGFHINSIERNREELQEMLHEILGVKFRIVCVKDEQGILKQVRKKAAYVDKKSEFEKMVNSNEKLKKIIDTFNAEFIR